MAQGPSMRAPTAAMRIGYGFAAGFLATLLFHQIGLALLHAVGLAPRAAYDVRPVPPFGMPAVIQLAFWGGVWGIAFAFAERAIARCPGGYWLGAPLVGAIVPTAFAWFVVAPLKGLPVGYGFHFPGIAGALIVDGLWGLGTGAFLRLLPGAATRPR
jgi:hypothetical protein